MNLRVKDQVGGEAVALATRILRDWARQIGEPVGVLGAQFRVLVASGTQSQKSNNYHLTISLHNNHLQPPQLLSKSGQLSTFGQQKSPFIPTHLSQLTIANSISITILQYYLNFISNPDSYQHKTHKLNCVECLRYFGAFNVSAKANSLMENARGNNILDGGAPFYAIYATKQGLLAVGNLEPKFFLQMVQEMGLTSHERQFCIENQINSDAWPKMQAIFSAKFMEKTAEEWEQKMAHRDTCVTMVRNFEKMGQNFLHPYLLKPKL